MRSCVLGARESKSQMESSAKFKILSKKEKGNDIDAPICHDTTLCVGLNFS